jgi:multidrug efflux pump subunit AcrB
LGPRSATIRVELPQGELTSDFLERTQLRANSGIYVPLADIVSVQRTVGFSTVRRENGIRLISVTGDVSEDDPEAAEQVFETLKKEILPEIATVNQVEWRMSGLAEQEQDFLNDARVGMILTLLGIYLVLTWIFASWTRPFVIMSIIPFGLVGTIYGHFIWDVPMSMFTIVGLIGMTGIIINDSIVLISTIDEYSKDRGIIPSIIDGSVDRLRPVLLTTFTTVLGLAPLLYERSTQAQFLKPTVITLVYGLGFGLLIVLLVIPALVAMQEDIKRFRKAYLFALRSQNKFIQRSFVSLTSAIILWGVMTLGFMLITGSLAPFLGDLSLIQTLPETMLSALILFVTGSLSFISLFALAGYFLFWKSRNLLEV